MKWRSRSVPCLTVLAGDAVWYAPVQGGVEYAASVAENPRRLGGQWVVRIQGLPEEYCRAVGRDRRVVAAAACTHIRPRRTMDRAVSPKGERLP